VLQCVTVGGLVMCCSALQCVADSFACVTRRIHMSDVTHSCMCDMTPESLYKDCQRVCTYAMPAYVQISDISSVMMYDI